MNRSQLPHRLFCRQLIFAGLCLWVVTAFAVSEAAAGAAPATAPATRPAEPAGRDEEEALSLVAQHLRAYYADPKREPDWKHEIDRLGFQEREGRLSGEHYLKELLVLSAKDEASGVAPWHATPYWGSSGENPARELRRHIVDALAESPRSEAVLPVLRWVFDEEKQPAFQAKAAEALAKVSGKEADDMVLRLATAPHPNSAVAIKALAEASARHLRPDPDRLKALCHHYRPGIREAARSLSRQLGDPDPGPFDPVAAVRSEPVAGLMAELSALLVETAPADAPFVVVTTAYEVDGKKKEFEWRGWLLGEDEQTFTLFTAFGSRREVRRRDAGDERRDRLASTSTFVKVSIEKEVERVAALRAAGDPDSEMSEQGPLTGQFQGHGAGLYEAFLGQWLYANHQFDQAAGILLPALDTLYRDEDLLRVVRQRLGVLYGHRMLKAFAGDRDYDAALKIATLLADRFPETMFHDVAAELKRQLPMRADDFKELALPTPTRWEELKAKMSRQEQIEYLARRVRLLNCFQMGQPGGYRENAKQYAEPCGMSDNAAWGLGRGKTEVINPLVELESLLKTSTVADVPALAPFVREDWLMPTVSFWRDFSPGRSVSSTRRLFASMIWGVAQRRLVPENLEGPMDDQQFGSFMQGINEWCRTHDGMTRAQLVMDALKHSVEAGERWREVSPGTLVDEKLAEAVPLVVQFLPREEGDWERYRILNTCRLLDPAASRDAASNYAADRRQCVRLEANMILLAAGDAAEKAGARKAIGETLSKAYFINEDRDSALEAVTALLTDGTPEARAAAAQVFESKALLDIFGEDSRTRLVGIFTRFSLPDGCRFYLRLMQDPPDSLVWSGKSKQDARDQLATDLVRWCGAEDAGLKQIATGTKEDSPERTVAVQAWLTRKVAEFEPKK